MRRAAVAAAVALALVAPAAAAWSAGATGTGNAAAKTLPSGNVPSGSGGIGTVSLTWTASAFAGGGAVPGYVVRRFNSVTLAEATVGGGCAGVVAATSCVETGVTTGTWRYTITPAAGTWRGGQSAQSAAIVVI